MELPKKTFRLDLIRSSANGILDVGFHVFAILIAIRFLEASESYKSILAAGSAIGFFIVPWVIEASSRLNIRVTKIAGTLMLLCSLLLFLSSSVRVIQFYTLYLVLAQICLSQMPGLMIHVYSNNYKAQERGQYISWNFILGSIMGIIFSYFFGSFLDQNGNGFYILFIIMGGLALIASVTLFWMPSTPVKQNMKAGIMASGFNAFKDKLFFKMIVGWMLMGLGVHMTIPLRVEYMAGQGGLGITNEDVSIIVICYSAASVLTSRIWAKLFDRFQFIPYRIAINVFLLLSVLLFFSSSGIIGLAVGSTLSGIANGGSSIAWSLWVTKLAPAGKETSYMGVHVFMTGLRGLLAPFFGYFLLSKFDFMGMAYFSFSLILVSLLIFLTELKSTRLK